jgi:hypothetical protein
MARGDAWGVESSLFDVWVGEDAGAAAQLHGEVTIA